MVSSVRQGWQACAVCSQGLAVRSISAPGRSFSSREESCLTECARRYIDTTQFVLQVCTGQSKLATA